MNSSFSDNEGIAHKWKASDSFKVTKLRVASREELQKRREIEEQRNRKTSTATSDAKSYLKSRRQKAKDERRQNIIGILDDNLDRLETSSPRNAKGALYGPTTSRLSPANDESLRSPKHTLKKEEKQGRLRALNPFRQKNMTPETKDRRDLLQRTKSGRRATLRQKEQKETIGSVKQSKGKESEMQEIVEEVLRKYPKERCKTFADHKEFAFAELTVRSNRKKDFHVDAQKLNELKSMLESRLSSMFAKEASFVASEKTEESKYSQQCRHRSNNDQSIPRDSPNGPSRNYNLQNCPGKKASSRHNLHYQHQSKASPQSSPRRSATVNVSPTTIPQRHRTIMPPPPLMSSPRKSPSPQSNVLSSPSPRPKSSQSLQVPTPRSSSMRLAPYIEKDDHTTTTENDDESTLVPVVKLELVDINGQVGIYTGTIDVNTGLPQGSGRLEYEDNGMYKGDFCQGKWSGFGRYCKPNGDVYEGNYFENVKHGIGIYKYRDGKRVFDGRYVMGQRVDGKMTYGDGSIYKGQWYDGKRHGRGTYRFKDGSVYKGEFKKDVIHGVGQLVWPDGAKYIGEWSEGHRHGLGKEYTADGRLRFDGRWKESVPLS